MRKINYIKSLVVLLTLSVFISCDETGDTDPGGTTVEQMAGDWYVQTLVDGNVVIDHQLISTYNTAANTQEMWIDDHFNIWWFKCKSPVNTGAMTFGGTNLASSVEDDDPSTEDIIETYDITINITDGKILKDAATTSGGNRSDSIVFFAEFSDDPGTIYQLAGYRRTGFLEDEH